MFMEELNKTRYEHINTKEKYDTLLKTGLFFEFHPELTGCWLVDLPLIYGGCIDEEPFASKPLSRDDCNENFITASKMSDIACSYNMQFNLHFVLDSILKSAKEGKYQLSTDHSLCEDIWTALSELGYHLDCIDGKTMISWYN